MLFRSIDVKNYYAKRHNILIIPLQVLLDNVVWLYHKGQGVEGFATPKHLVKEDGSQAQLDEKLEFKVIEFNKDAKRIIHMKIIL